MSGPVVNASLLELLTSHSPQLRENADRLTSDAQLAQLGIDSLELLSLSLDIEESYDIEIDNSDLAAAATVGDLAALIDVAVRRKTA